jgi:hypothetical protein
LLHFPLIFIIGAVFKKEDLLQLGRLMLTHIMVTTCLFQFISPQTAYTNREEVKGVRIFSAMWVICPSGTFHSQQACHRFIF